MDKKKELLKKFDALMAEAVDDALDPETLTFVSEKIKSIFKKNEIPFQRSTLKAMFEGMMFMMFLERHEEESMKYIAPATVRKLIFDMDAKITKQLEQK